MTPDSLTLPTLLLRNAKDHGAKAAIVTDEGSISHAELNGESATLARRLVGAGIGKSSRVGLLMENGIEWAVLATAVMRTGAVLVPLSTLLQPPELHSQLHTATVTELIVPRRFRDRHYLADLEAVAPGITDITADGRRHAELANLRSVWATDAVPTERVDRDLVSALENRVGPADDLVILFTSGSRGDPKGVIHAHGGAIRATEAGLACRRIGSGTRLYIPMPFFWTGGFSGGLMTALVAGASLITEAVPEPARTLALLERERERVTLFRGWPDQAARLASHPTFGAADLTTLGAGSLPAVLPAERRPAPGARANLFGMTETFGPYCGERLDTDLPPDKRGSCGRPFTGVEVRVLDLESGAGLPPGVDGEVAVRGPNVMRGICGRTRAETFEADGFYRTGDMGMLDADGYLWYRGRSDDMFKVKGATVYPSEVEEALGRLERVEQAFVTNIPGPDGDQVGALVVAGLAPDTLDTAVRATLSSFKVPSLWYVTDRMEDVPRTTTGKVAKTALQDLIGNAGKMLGAATTTGETSQKGTRQ